MSCVFKYRIKSIVHAYVTFFILIKIKSFLIQLCYYYSVHIFSWWQLYNILQLHCIIVYIHMLYNNLLQCVISIVNDLLWVMIYDGSFRDSGKRGNLFLFAKKLLFLRRSYPLPSYLYPLYCRHPI